ncbi:MAG TPA: TIGR00730 family Rossman fold protein [Candidatus Deferrimicrobiaceae bacterium]
MELRRLCVFCSSSDHLPEAFREEARALGARLAKEDIELVFGGGSVGMMGVLADAVLAGGGTVTGVIPSFLATKELAHEGITRQVVTGTMHERKQEMSRLADAFAILPGGFGTLDEFFEILTWKQLGLHDRPIVVANTGGWFEPLREFCRQAVSWGAVTRRNVELFSVVPSAMEIVPALQRIRATAAARKRLSRT